MKANQDLHQLIKSLSKTEKTYFRKFAARHFENSSFIKLFNELEKKNGNGPYTENDIRQKYRGEGFTLQLPVTKNYLYNNILKSLNLYYTEDNIDIKLSSLMNSALILYRKELYGQSIKMINKAKLLAERFDKPSKLLEAIHIERQALRINSSLNEVAAALLRNYDEELEVLEKLRNISEYRKLYDRMVIFATAKGTSAPGDKSKTMEKLFKNRLLTNYNNARYFQSRVIYMLMHCFINNLKGNYKASLSFGRQFLELVGDSPDNKTIAAYEYLLVLQEMVFSTHLLGMNEDSEMYYGMITRQQEELLKNAPRKVRNFLLMRTLTNRVNVNSGLGRFEDNVQVVKEMIGISMQNESASYRDEIVVTDFIAASVYFTLARYDEAVYHLNRIFNSKTYELREDIQVTCRVFNLILHYELGHMGSLEYYAKSTYRYLKKRGSLNPVERLLFDFLRKSQGVTNNKEMIKLFRETRARHLELMKKKPQLLQFVDLDAWFKSKIEKKPYTEIVKEKSRAV